MVCFSLKTSATTCLKKFDMSVTEGEVVRFLPAENSSKGLVIRSSSCREASHQIDNASGGGCLLVGVLAARRQLIVIIIVPCRYIEIAHILSEVCCHT